MPVHNYLGIGLMSGSSLDGLDLALVDFEIEDGRIYDWKLKAVEEIHYDEKLRSRLLDASNIDAKSFCTLDHDLGLFFGASVKSFIDKNSANIDFIASHGHTVFHFPERGFSTQIGNPACIRAKTNLKVIHDFRSVDVAYGGEGAPLAPLVEHHLYTGHDLYLNLGGIANISYHPRTSGEAIDQKIIAFDVCPVNQLLNKLAQEKGLTYDNEGLLAKAGKLSEKLYAQLSTDPYLLRKAPKSMDNSYIQNYYFPLFDKFDLALEDKLYTCTQFIAEQLSLQIEANVKPAQSLSCFVSGGGAFNKFLMEKIKEHCPRINFIIPEMNDIKYKEAILMALLGLLRLTGQTNSMASVTGASMDTVNGAIYY